MRLSQIFLKTQKNFPSDEVALNAKLLEKAGFIYKNLSGVYSFLPLGWIVMQKIMKVIREEMQAIGAEEIMMPALVSKEIWQKTGRWDAEIGYEVSAKNEKNPEFILGWTHEEVITEIMTHYIDSYKDLPRALYQIQTKFRNEPRAKSGLIRGREFIMKDLYSFHKNKEDLLSYYEKVAQSYHKIFKRLGLNSIYTLASGGAFTTQATHEFQVVCPAGEDDIFVCESCNYAENKEVSNLSEGAKCPKCGGKIKKEHAVEVGNIFPLETKYSKDFELKYKDEKGGYQYVLMGSYGIGIGRALGTIVELYNDEKGIIWPKEVAPAKVYLIAIDKNGDDLYEELKNKGIEVIYDDRDIGIGEKFYDADLIGLPYRLIVSPKTGDKIEFKKRNENNANILEKEKVISLILENN